MIIEVEKMLYIRAKCILPASPTMKDLAPWCILILHLKRSVFSALHPRAVILSDIIILLNMPSVTVGP